MVTENNINGTVAQKVEQLAETGRNDSAVASDWIELIDEAVDLSNEMRKVVRRQAESANRAKPIGLFFDDGELIDQVAVPPAVDSDASDEEKRNSLIESYQWHAEEKLNHRQIPPNVVIPEVAEILEASALPNPDGDLLAYVEEKYREMTTMNIPGAE